MKKKPLLFAVSALMSFSFLASCGGNEVTPDPEPETATITVVNGEGSGTYEVGTDLTITATIPTNYIFSRWEVDGVSVSTDASYTFTVSEDKTYTAVFDLDNVLRNYTRTVYKKANKDFKILNLTDIQLHNGDNHEITKHIIDTLVEREQPDLITCLGDINNDSTVYGCDESFKKTVELLDSYDIPWAPIFGNHDQDNYRPEGTKKNVSTDEMIEAFVKSKNCLFIRGPQTVEGKSNYIVNVVEEGSNKLVESLVFLDSLGHGLQSTHVTFYEDAINYVTALNGGTVVPSVCFAHIPLMQLQDAYFESQKNEYRDMVGGCFVQPLSAGTRDFFPKMKELGSTHIYMSGHDHQNAYYSEIEGIKLAYAMKSSEGDDIDGVSHRYPLGGAMIDISDNKPEEIRYTKVDDVPYTFSSSFDHHIALPYWRYSGAKLVFDIKMPSSGSIKVNLQGTNLMRTSVSESVRMGQWNRLTDHEVINAETLTADHGTLTPLSDGYYRYKVDVTDFKLNVGSEESFGDETVRNIYFHSATGGDYSVRDTHFEFEEVTETNQVDLSAATIGDVAQQFYQDGVPLRPKPEVKMNGVALKPVDDILYTYENNVKAGTAKLTVVPSGKGAHKYKGSKTVEFNISGVNPDDDTLPGHETAKVINGDDYPFGDSFVTCNDWHNGNKKLHLEFKRLQYGLVESGETARIALMGSTGHTDAPNYGNAWNRFTDYYKIDFSNKGLVCYLASDPNEILAVGTSIGDGWFAIELPLANMRVNTAEHAYGDALETLERLSITQVTRSFKFDHPSIVE